MENSPPAAILRLGAMIRRARKDRGITGAQLASRVLMSQSTISKIETGKYGLLRKEDLITILEALDLSREVKLQIIRQRELSQLDPSTYLYMQAEGVDGKQAQIRDLESNAKLIRVYQSSVIPGLLQTREYAQIIFSALGHSAEAVSKSVEQRLLRQSTLRRISCCFIFIIEESVFRGPDLSEYDERTHIEQVELLKALSAAPNVSIKHLSHLRPRPISAGNPFTLIDRRYVTAETTVRELTSTDPIEIRQYENEFRKLFSAAVDGLPDWLSEQA